MSWIVRYCLDCKVLLFDPEVIEEKDLPPGAMAPTESWFEQYVNCPVCKTVRLARMVRDLSDL